MKVLLFQDDLYKFETFNPCTHVYSFLGYAGIVNTTSLIIALSETVQYFIPIVLHNKELKNSGMMFDNDVLNKEVIAIANGTRST